MRVAVVCFAVALGALAASCGERPRTPAIPGDAERGRLLLRQYGCGTCHRIPDVAAAKGTVGPPLDRVGGQVYLGGVLPNSPENMAHGLDANRSYGLLSS